MEQQSLRPQNPTSSGRALARFGSDPGWTLGQPRPSYSLHPAQKFSLPQAVDDGGPLRPSPSFFAKPATSSPALKRCVTEKISMAPDPSAAQYQAAFPLHANISSPAPGNH